MLVILDSNLLFSALISPHGLPALSYKAWREGRYDLVTCPEQIDEIRRASRYPKFRAILQPHLVGLMINNLQRAVIIDAPPHLHEADDPSDAYLLDLASAAKAHYLVTGDIHAGLLQRRRSGATRIVTAAIFCNSVLRIS
jgi:putative PIN family toxin of toxin-antitoxin system